jgi:rhodanese-related sulfurtransferase
MIMDFWKMAALRAAALVVASIVMGVVHNYVFSFEGIRLSQSPLQAVSGLEEARFIRLEEAKQKWSRNVIFLDARAREFYSYEGHIEGALSLPYEDFEGSFQSIEDKLVPKDREVVCYCSGFGCEESAELAKLLMARGFSRVFVYEGGWPEWLEAGLPVEMPD